MSSILTCLSVPGLILSVLIAAPAADADEFARMRLPDDIRSAEDSARLSELSVIAQFLDTSWWAVNLQTARTTSMFMSRIRRHQEAHPEEWNRAYEGLAWARDSARCYGTPWEPDGEVRWPYFVRFGCPTSWWETDLKTDWQLGGRPVPAFFYWWTPFDTGLACHSAPGQTFPTELLRATAEDPESRRLILPVVEIVSFPNADGTEDVWVTVGINGNELTAFTLDHQLLEIEWTVRNDEGKAVAGERVVHRLGLVGMVLRVTGSRARARVPIHFCAPRLARGVYTLDIEVRGRYSNGGRESVEFTVPSPLASAGMSDLLLVFPRGPRGTDLAPGVGRNGRDFCAVTDPRFFAGDTIVPYVEFALPEGEGWAYAVSVYLRPVRAVRGAIVRTGRPVVIADSNSSPLARWAGIDIQQELRELGINDPSPKDAMRLLAARVFRGEGGFGVFESSFQITPETKLGEYWLTIEVEGADANGRTFWASSQKRIAIIRSYTSQD